MEQREGSRCAKCDSNLRSGHLAGAIVAEVNAMAHTRATHLSGLFRDARARALAIAEINSADTLHRYLKGCPGLRYSEFGSQAAEVPSEDLMALSYPDASFDLVITSDTLEHVPEIGRALREIFRVLKPGGAHVFSVPAVMGRPTRQRARLVQGQVTHLLPPTFHAGPAECSPDFLVFYEFGDDFEALCTEAGFEMAVLRDAANPSLVTFIGRRRA
jgi:SAM-dependent methyltransferase